MFIHSVVQWSYFINENVEQYVVVNENKSNKFTLVFFLDDLDLQFILIHFT